MKHDISRTDKGLSRVDQWPFHYKEWTNQLATENRRYVCNIHLIDRYLAQW